MCTVTKLKRSISAILLILAGAACAGLVLLLLAKPVGAPCIHFHNAHSTGQISIGDAAWTGVTVLGPILLAAAIFGLLKKHAQFAARYFFIGIITLCVGILGAMIALFVSLSRFSW